jgi:uncharacterized protein (DUF302 family)
MLEQVGIINTCPICGKKILSATQEYIEFIPCQHYVWYSNLGSIGNDEIWMYGLKLRLLKR